MSSSKKCLFVGLLSCGLLAPSASFAEKSQPSMEHADTEYVHSLVRANGGGITLNLADPAQERFLRARIKMWGKTRENSPQFFQALEQARLRHVARAKKGTNGVVQSVLPTPGDDHIIIDLSSDDDIHFDAAAMASLYTGSVETDLDVCLYDTSYSNMLSCNYTVEYMQGYETVVTSSGSLSFTGNPVLVDSVSCAETHAGTFDCTVREAVTKAAAKYAISSPQDWNLGSKDIFLVCLNRGGSDCEVQKNNGNIIGLPLKGEVRFQSRVYLDADADSDGIPDNVEKTAISILMGTTGGFCGTNQMDLDPAQFWGHVNTRIKPNSNDRILEFDLWLDFGTKCYSVNERVRLSVEMSIQDTSGDTHTAIFTSVENVGDPLEYPNLVPMISFRSSCVAEGTLVRLGNGKAAPIDQISLNQQVSRLGHRKADASMLTVTDISTGREPSPMIRLIDDQGHQLLITKGHPVMTPNGGVVAGDLAVGDAILTEQGVAKLTSVTREPYEGMVYNLQLGSEAELESLAGVANATTMVANGIVIGDSSMQTNYSIEAQKHPETTLDRVPVKWRQDYLNNLARKAHGTTP